MPIEFVQLKDQPSPLAQCPHCGATPFEPFLRGMVQGGWRKIFSRPYCALICTHCKDIVGYERPPVSQKD